MHHGEAASALAAWYAKHARDLPWRRGVPDPYHVLVAEFVFQQTRMETGLPYYERFLARFPTVHALAAANEADVLALWSGLGYYARARRLRATAQEIVMHHGGRVPQDIDALRELPGIGPYTAGAIASIAYDRAEPAIDGNHARVLGRYLGVKDAETAQSRRRIEQLARELVGHASPRIVNQALMDLGASVCLPSSPRCGACPLAAGCRSKDSTKRRRKAAPKTVEDREVLLHVRDGRLWLVAPSRSGLLANLWLPAHRPARRPIKSPAHVHAFSHRMWRLRFVRPRGIPTGRGRWVAPHELPRLPHGRLTRVAMQAAFSRA